MADRSAQKTDPFEPPAILYGLPDTTYFALPAASSHFLRKLLEASPLHAKTAPDTPTKAKDLGSLAHALILEPARADDVARIKPKGADKASNAGKTSLVDFYCKVLMCDAPSVQQHDLATGKPIAPGKVLDAMLETLEPLVAAREDLIVTSQSEFDTAQRMRDSVIGKPLGRVLFEDGDPEVTVIARRPGTGTICKIRVDWMPAGMDVMVDLKTAASATWEDSARSFASYGYQFQASFYQHVESWLSGRPRRVFIHAMVENVPPYDSAFYRLDKKALKLGEQQWKRALDIYERCVERNFWPGLQWSWQDNEYLGLPEDLSLPGWATKGISDAD